MLTDEILAEHTLKGDLSAFEELVNRYKQPVFGIAYRMVGQYQEAEDITQEVFFTVFEKLHLFDTRKKFKPWIYRIATNTSISALRKRKKVVTLAFDETFNQGEDYHLTNTDPHTMFERKELQEEIFSTISNLPENYKTVIILRYQMDLSNQEIADVLGVSKENVEVRIHRARKALRKLIKIKWEERGMKNELPANR